VSGNKKSAPRNEERLNMLNVFIDAKIRAEDRQQPKPYQPRWLCTYQSS
jgi:hypothetical protein